MVPTGNSDKISGFESVAKAGIKLGMFSGAVEGDYAKDAGVSSGDIVNVPDMPSGVTQLEQGRIGRISPTSITLNWHLQQNPDVDAEVTEPFTPVVNGKEVLGCGAPVFRKDDTDLVNAFNKQLQKLKDSGELANLIGPSGSRARRRRTT